MSEQFLPPDKTYVENRACTRDSKRNAIAMITSASYDQAEEAVSTVLRCAGIEFYLRRKSYVGTSYRNNQWDFEREPMTGNRYPGVFLEPAVMRDEHGFREDSKETFMVWIYFTIKRKELTAWRKRLIPLFLPKA